MEKKVNLAPPWITYFKEIEALFAQDPDVRVEFDEEGYGVTIYVEGQDKADAIDQLLPDEMEFGNIKMKITVVPANKLEMDKVDLLNRAFAGNPAFAYAKRVEGVFTNPIYYAVMQKKVVQFYNDDLHDINGNMNTLYQDIAKDVIGEEGGICFCTNNE